MRGYPGCNTPASPGAPSGCPGTVGALSPAPSWSPVPVAQLCFCSSLQSEAGLRKGPAAAKRSRSRSAPPAAEQGLPCQPAAAVAFPRLRWLMATMEEMVIWEQHTVTLSKVSMALGGRRRGRDLWGRLCLTLLCLSPLGPSTGLWLRCLRRPGPSQQDDRGHSSDRFRCGVRGTSDGPAPVSVRGRGDMVGARCQWGWEEQRIAPARTGPARLPPCLAGMGSSWGNGCPHHPASTPSCGLCLGQSHSCIFPPRRKDHIVMVNGLSMENVSSSFAIQTLKTCGKIANIVSVPCSGMGVVSHSPIPHTPGFLFGAWKSL